VVNSRNPLLSVLVLAPRPEDKEPGVLYAHEIHDLDLRRLGLVVLAACGSAQGAEAGGGTSLARAFLAAGAGPVVATLWRIDDREAAALFDVFYQRLRAGDDPVAALRAAQVDSIANGAPASVWGAFTISGPAR
jgi:CHAT domain-containing protein